MILFAVCSYAQYSVGDTVAPADNLSWTVEGPAGHPDVGLSSDIFTKISQNMPVFLFMGQTWWSYCGLGAPVLITEWTNKYGPDAPDGPYKNKAYWVATENWPGQNYPVHVTDPGGLYADIGTSGFYIGGTPTYAIIGFQNKVFYDGSGGPYYDTTNFFKAMDDAIDSFPTTDTYVANPISDKLYLLGGTGQIDLTNVFASQSEFSNTR